MVELSRLQLHEHVLVVDEFSGHPLTEHFLIIRSVQLANFLVQDCVEVFLGEHLEQLQHNLREAGATEFYFSKFVKR